MTIQAKALPKSSADASSNDLHSSPVHAHKPTFTTFVCLHYQFPLTQNKPYANGANFETASSLLQSECFFCLSLIYSFMVCLLYYLRLKFFYKIYPDYLGLLARFSQWSLCQKNEIHTTLPEGPCLPISRFPLVNPFEK